MTDDLPDESSSDDVEGQDVGESLEDVERLDEFELRRETARNRDGVAALRDTEAEAGDEEESDDAFDLDDREARELGIHLDGRDEPEPRLD